MPVTPTYPPMRISVGPATSAGPSGVSFAISWVGFSPSGEGVCGPDVFCAHAAEPAPRMRHSDGRRARCRTDNVMFSSGCGGYFFVLFRYSWSVTGSIHVTLRPTAVATQVSPSFGDAPCQCGTFAGRTIG